MAESSPANTSDAKSSDSKTSDVQKRCCRCGKDLTGRTRYKNSEGYWCKTCNADDELRKSRLGGKKKGSGKKLPTIWIIAGAAVVLAVLLYLFVL